MSVEFFTNDNDKNATYCHKRLRKDEKTQPLLTQIKSMIGENGLITLHEVEAF
jgi:hypothetical protein